MESSPFPFQQPMLRLRGLSSSSSSSSPEIPSRSNATTSSSSSNTPPQSPTAATPPPPKSTTTKTSATTMSELTKTQRSQVYADAATRRKVFELKQMKKNPGSRSSGMLNNVSQHLFVRVGAPFLLFSLLGVWVVSNSLDGKLKEMEVSQGKGSKSLRQAALEAEHEEMMERLNKIVASDYDNTKRIKRPEEILEERRLERQRRNAWHRRLYRSIFGEQRRRDDD